MGVKVRERDGAWWLFIDYQGRRKAKRVGPGKVGKKAAELAAVKIKARLAEGDTTVLDATATPSLTFAAFAQQWLERYPLLHTVRPGTMDNHRSFAKHHLIPHFGAVPIASITAASIENFIISKRQPGGAVRFRDRPLSESSLRTGLATLHLILQQAVRAGHLRVNPLGGLGRFKRANGDECVDPFMGAELRAILDAARDLKPDFAAMLRLWAQTGMRAGEVCGLQWQDLDLEAGTALVRRTWSRQRLGPTKTGIVRPVSFLHPTTEPTTEWRPGVTPASRLILTGLRRLTVRSLEPEAFVFGGGAVPVHSMELHRDWKRVLAAAKVRYRSPEQLRHTFASTMLSRNAPLLYVQRAGGWRSASVLLRVYARWVPEDITPAAPGQPSATQPQPSSDRRAWQETASAG
jgi:integrase